MRIRIWLAAASLTWSAMATADIIFFDVTAGNAAIAGFPGPYAHVVVDRTDSTHATITFTSLLSGGDIYLLGGQGAAAVNVNATSWSIGSFAASNGGTGFTPGPLSDDGSAHEDGWGVFNQTIDSFGGYTTELAGPATLFFVVLTVILTGFAVVLIVGHLIWGQKF